MRLLKALVTLLLLTIGNLYLGCGGADTTMPKRPSNVDNRAEWVGGVDGGVWIFCVDRPEGGNKVSCSIYGEGGNLWRTSDFFIRRLDFDGGKRSEVEADRIYTASEIHNIGFSWYDGRTIKVERNLILVQDDSGSPPLSSGQALSVNVRTRF